MGSDEPESGAGPEALDRRESERVTSVYRPAMLQFGGTTSVCMIKNISPGGLMAQTYATFVEGQKVVVILSQTSLVNGTVIWSDHEQIGIKFDAEFDHLRALGLAGHSEGDNRLSRAPRLPVTSEAIVRTAEATKIEAQLCDISAKGAKLLASSLKEGDEVTLQLADLPPKQAIVRWTKFGEVGLNFRVPLSYKDLAEWVKKLT